MPQGCQSGPKSELERELGLEFKVGLELLRDARRALELQAKDSKLARQLKLELESDLCELEVELVLKLEFELEREVKLEFKLELRLLRDARARTETPSLAELPLRFFSGLRKLALQRCELELLRSHPKDERGSVREIGLCDRLEPNLHFLELSPALWWELPRC